MDEDDRAEEAPGTALPIDVEHPQNLKESDAANGRGRKDLAVGAGPCQDDDGGRDDDEIDDADGLSEKLQPTRQPDVLGTATC